jgi:hypothetical protein
MLEVCSVKTIKPGFFNHLAMTLSAADLALGEARFQAYITQLRADPDATIVQSIIPSGVTVETVITSLLRRHFWEDKNRTACSSRD